MDNTFYKNGLAFECQRCSACCRFDPGYVFLSKKDLQRLSEAMKMDQNTFIDKYCRSVDIGEARRISLLEKPNNDCIFWTSDGCQVYKARPLQCKSYPFWYSTLSCKERWDAESKDCPGINKGKVHTAEEIKSYLAWRDREPIIEEG